MAVSWGVSLSTGIEATYNPTANTNVRDVSDVLDAVYLADTPFLNKLTWGPAATATTIEWVSDNIGYGYIVLSNGGDLSMTASSFVVGTSGLGAASLAMHQVNTGTILKAVDCSTQMGYLIVEDFSIAGSIVFAIMSGTTCGSDISDGTTLFVVGSPVNEGSTPRRDRTRPRTLLSNKTQIFRQDVQMTGTRQAIAMYAVRNEFTKQVGLRAMEYKRELERTLIIGHKNPVTASITEVRTMGGIYDFLKNYSGSHIDTSTTTLTEAAINAVAAEVFNKGGEPNTMLISPTQARNIPTFERARVRVDQDSRIAGFFVTKYLTDLGNLMDILISRWVPTNFAFILDAGKIHPRALVGRKYIAEKLARDGDRDKYQIISEVSLEFNGVDKAQHGMMTALT